MKPASILEYGCGQSALHEILRQPGRVFDCYDPAIPALSKITREQYEFLISTDVLEHIPTEDVPAGLAHLRRLSPHAFLRISTRPARTILPDGRNAHFTVWPGEQWLNAIHVHFPDARLVFELKGKSCVIITWQSKVAAEIARIETELERKRQGKVKQFFKGIERSVRSVRDAVFGKEKPGSTHPR